MNETNSVCRMAPANRVTLDFDDLSVLLRYQELALKGKNRPWFQRHLIRHLRRALAGLGVSEVRVPMGRIEVVLGREATAAEVRERLRHVFGLANFSLATRVAPDVRRHRGRHPARSAAGHARQLPRQGAPRGQAGSRCAHQRSSGRSARGSRRRAAGRWTSRIRRSPSAWRSCRARPSTTSARSRAPAGCRWAPAAAWWRCCRAASTRRWPPGG